MDTKAPAKSSAPMDNRSVQGSRWRSVFRTLNAGLNYDFCPNLNKYVYWLRQPIGWVVCGAFASCLVGFFIGPQGFILMCSLLALLAIGAVWPWLSMKGLDCRLSFDRSRSQEGNLTNATVEITNKWPIPVFGLMVEGEFLLDLLDEDDRVAIGLQRVPAMSVSRFSWSFEPKQRGILPFDEPTLTNGFPFGLYQCRRPIEIQKQTIVWPADCQLNGSPGLDGTQFSIAGMMSDRPGVDGDTIGIRQYRQGDSLKHVHWPKTATLGRMIVQERQTKAQRPFEVIVDLTADHHRGHGSQSSYEWAIRVASSVCTQLHRHQAEVQLICLGLDSEARSRCSNIAGIGQLLDFLATLPTIDVLRSKDCERKHVTFGIGSHQIKRFFICTNLSSDNFGLGGPVADTQRIELACERFDLTLEEEQDSPVTETSNRPGIGIASPGQAVADLQSGWSRGMCYES